MTTATLHTTEFDRPRTRGHFQVSFVAALPYIYFVVIFLLAVGGGGNVCRYFALGAAAIVGGLLYSRNKAIYTAFVWWLWFLIPFIRRILNYQSGWIESDPIIAAPLLASVACTTSLLTDRIIWQSRYALPFKLAIFATAYGLCAGIAFLPFQAFVIAAVAWVLPIIFGVFLFSQYAKGDADAITSAIENSFVWGLLVMGLYGMIQFVFVPPWDALWLSRTSLPVFGLPEPFAIRVFSTMNSPLPLALAMFVGLILLLRKKTRFALLATLCGYGALTLSLIRTSWGLWAIATTLVLVRRPRLTKRFVTTLGLLVVFFLVVVSFGPVQQFLVPRFVSLTKLGDDDSFQGRAAAHEQLLDKVVSDPVGWGIGAMDYLNINGATGLGVRDSGVLEIFLNLGWLAGVTYLAAFAAVVWFQLEGWASATSLEVFAGAIAVAMIGEVFFASIDGFSGFVFWGFTGISAGLQTYAKRRRQYGDGPSTLPLLARQLR